MAGVLSSRIIALLALLQAARSELPLQDATATVNQLFSYQLDAADFPNQNLQVSVTYKHVMYYLLCYCKLSIISISIRFKFIDTSKLLTKLVFL